MFRYGMENFSKLESVIANNRFTDAESSGVIVFTEGSESDNGFFVPHVALMRPEGVIHSPLSRTVYRDIC